MSRRPAFLLGWALLAAASVAQSADAGSLTALCYHRFGAETAKDPYKISEARLEGQLAWFQAQGYQSVSLKQMEAAAQGQAALPEKSLLLSVDDGYTSGLSGAALFEKHGFKGVYFVNPGSIGGKSFMSWKDCRDLEKRGHEVASHTLTHPNLASPPKGKKPAQYRAWVEKELGEARRLLEKELGHPVTALAWPFGAYNPALSAAAKRLGYSLQFSVSDGVNPLGELDPLRLRRILLMGHPAQEKFQKRMLLQPVAGGFDAFQEGALFLAGAAPLALTAAAGIKITMEGKALKALPGKVEPGFHFLTLSQAERQTKLLFQVARKDRAPYYDALTEP